MKTTDKSPDGIIVTNTELVQDKTDGSGDMIKMADMSALRYILRGFPFEDDKSLHVTRMGMDSSFKLYTKVVKKEKVKTPAGEFSSCLTG